MQRNHVIVSCSSALGYTFPLLLPNSTRSKRMNRIDSEKENNNLQLSKRYIPLETPRSLQDAMQYLSRTWSPSSSTYVDQLLSASSLMSIDQRKKDKSADHEEQDYKLQMCTDTTQKMEQLWMVVPDGKVHNSVSHRNSKLHSSWKGILTGEVVTNLSWGHRRKKKEEMRMHAAQVNATLSVAKLAAAIAGVVSNSHMEPSKSRDLCIAHLGEEIDGKMGMVVTSATALVAAVCAEAAESMGASKKQVAIAMDMGAETRDPADLVMLTANAATCLRGVSALKLRGLANDFALEGSKILERGVLLPVRIPSGSIQLRWVHIHVNHKKIMLKLGKKCLYGAFKAYKEYIILEKIEEATKGNSLRKGNGCFVITLSTSGGTIELLFEDRKHYTIWNNAIFNLMLNSQ
ncbi:auxin canalization protein (DUF828) [Rhynchospora pubera]|uniref:Auxin canalization protein (DUF828) n=1 Tax=Rhynchospora pubera TaxID=906938 RepID=A0AAV8H620_9POAL|nr:auxin canalization protein (DUF828) [Rhynchospora pubera]